MPSNAEYKKEATELADKLGLPVQLDNLNNQQLATLVSDLKAKARDAENSTQADNTPAATEGGDNDQEPPEADEEPAEPAKKPPFSVAEGKSITSKRGILQAGDEVKASDLAGGETALQALVKAGHVAKA